MKQQKQEILFLKKKTLELAHYMNWKLWATPGCPEFYWSNSPSWKDDYILVSFQDLQGILDALDDNEIYSLTIQKMDGQWKAII
jgi:hypothetical protein